MHPDQQPVLSRSEDFSQTAFPSRKKVSRVGGWFAAFALLLLFIVGCSTGGNSSTSTGQSQSSTNPTATSSTTQTQQPGLASSSALGTVQIYCSAVKAKEYHTAYQQFSRHWQSQTSELAYTQNLQNAFALYGDLKQYNIVNVTQTSSSAADGKVSLIYTGGLTSTVDVLLIYENGAWKIDSWKLKS